jgi:hypothetical protein
MGMEARLHEQGLMFAPQIVLGLSCLFTIHLAAAEVGIVDELIAKCNGDIITRGEVDRPRYVV